MKDKIIKWIKEWFNSTNGKTAIIGISGGKDSTVCAALCAEALGKNNVIGVMMPNGFQRDINDSIEVCKLLGIKNYTVNIINGYEGIIKAIAENNFNFGNELEDVPYGIKTNLPARLRMSVLYSIASLFPNGRVCNTCNRSEDYIGYSTKFGDSAGDFSPLSNLTVREVKEIGDELGLPYSLVHKVPSDGMCGKSDEDNLGFTYKTLDDYLLDGIKPEKEILEKIEKMHTQNLHKLEKMPAFIK